MIVDPGASSGRRTRIGAIALVLCALSGSPARGGDPPPVGPFLNPTNGHWYFSLWSVDFAEARGIATAVGGYVASVGDLSEQQWLLAQFPVLQHFLSIGLTDEAVPGTYAWESGEPLGFTDWGPGQPAISSGPQHARGLSSWESRPFDWVTEALIEVETPIIAVVPSFAATPLASGEIELVFDAPGFDAVRILRGGQIIASIPASAGSYLDTPSPGHVRYFLVALGSAGTSLPAQRSQNVPDPDYALRIPDASAPHPGPVELRVLLDSADFVEGFSFGVCYDTTALDLLAVAQGTEVLAASPTGADFFNAFETSEGFAIGVVIDFFGVLEMLPGSDLELIVATLGTPLAGSVAETARICDEIGIPPVTSVVVVAGSSLFPLRTPGLIELPVLSFRRGDGNHDGGVDLADALFLGEFLFDPDVNDVPCREACEVNGDGRIDIADMVYTLSYLFGGGPAPGAPFPGCGADPDPGSGFGCDAGASCP